MRRSEASGKRDQESLPLDIYASLVDALYSDARSLFVGAFAASMTTLITAFRTGEWSLYACAAAIVLLTIARAWDFRAFAAARPKLDSIEDFRPWELRYVTGAAGHVGLLGVFCLLSFWQTMDPFVHLFAFSITIAYLIGISGRNFASNLLVNTQIIIAGVPMMIALFIVGDLYYAVFAFVLVPFFLAFKLISARLRRTLLDAVISARNFGALASRFDTALNNMPHGLGMFDAQQHIDVWNERLTRLLRGDPKRFEKGAKIADLLPKGPEATQFISDVRWLGEEIENRLAARTGGYFVVETEDGQTLALTFNPMEKGGSVVLVEDVTERKKAEARIRHLARYDSLTGLPNRTYFHEQMEDVLGAARAKNEGCAVLFIDLDQFKYVNDTLGHPIGDQLLCAISDRVRAIMRHTDVVARFGGDEFVFIRSGGPGDEEAAMLANQIIEVLSAPYDIEGHQVVIGASIGIAMSPENGNNADLLLKNADMALYRAKVEERGSWRFFQPEMGAKAQTRRTLEMDLRKALGDGSLYLAFQPLYSLATNRFSACEALIRWKHPTRGLIPPSEFIPIAEDRGLIVDVGGGVLREACFECLRWPAGIRVSVNLSPIQFRRDTVLSAVREALAVTGLPPSRLEVEITESVLLYDVEATRKVLTEVREIGVRISLDDFGTGYSSLSYLHSFPLDKVKIDRSFLTGLGTTSKTLVLLRGVARLTSELGMLVAIEGVETEEQLELVANEGYVDEVQGYLFSKPVPGPDVRALLAATMAGVRKVA